MNNCNPDIQKFAYTMKKYPLDYPSDVVKAIDLLVIDTKNFIVFGSSSVKAMLYGADIDLRENIPLLQHAASMQKVIKRLLNHKEYGTKYLIGDIKAGKTILGTKLIHYLGNIINCMIDGYDRSSLMILLKEAKINIDLPIYPTMTEWIKIFKLFHDIETIRWTPEEIIKGVHNTGVKLIDATRNSLLNKIDIYFYYNNKYVEMTNVLDSEKIDNNDKILKGLKLNLLTYLYDDEPNYLKAIKRSYAISRLTSNCNFMSKVKNLLTGNIALLNSVKSDLDVIPEMISRGFDINKNKEKLNVHFSLLISRLSNVYVVDVPDDLFLILHKIQDELQGCKNIAPNSFIEIIEELSHNIGEIVNDKTLDYIKQNNINFRDFC